MPFEGPEGPEIASQQPAVEAGAVRQETAEERSLRETLTRLSLEGLAERTAEFKRQIGNYKGILSAITSKLKGERPMKADEDRALLERDENELEMLIARRTNGIEQNEKDRAAKIERGLLSQDDMVFLVQEDYHNVSKVPPKMIMKTDPGPDTPPAEATLWRAAKALQRERETGQRLPQKWVSTGDAY